MNTIARPGDSEDDEDGPKSFSPHRPIRLRES
jgi:hypothetical protein